MAWRVARSLDVLLAQLNEAYPRRSKASDGGIGDAAHATRDSDHNPWVLDGPTGIVTARDYTHDPANGLDCEQLYQALVRSRDDRIKYVIWNRTITSGAHDTAPWQRRPYSGINAHTKHLHLSVRPEKARYDNTAPWAIRVAAPAPAKPAPVEDDMFGDNDRRVQALILRQLGLEKNMATGEEAVPGWKQLGNKTVVDAIAELMREVDAIKAKLDDTAA